MSYYRDAQNNLLSPTYCGEIVSNSSVATGTPISVISHKSCRAMRKPLLILKEPSRLGSLMSPFHPTVVRGFYRIEKKSSDLGSPSRAPTSPRYKHGQYSLYELTGARRTYKYALMTMRRFGQLGICSLRRRAYAMACSGQWIEQGPTTIRRRSECPPIILIKCKRSFVLAKEWYLLRCSMSRRSYRLSR